MKIGLISDAHGHFRALKQGIDIVRGAGAEEILFLGDALGYIDCLKTIDVITDEGLIPIAGNHEFMIMYNKTPVEFNDVYQHSLIRARLSQYEKGILRTWPTSRLLYGGKLLAVHGSPSNPVNGYVYPDSNLDEHVVPAGVQFVVMGHTHRADVRRHGPVLYVNPGSCGLPRDIRSSGSVAILDLMDGFVEVFRFDISRFYPKLRLRVHSKVAESWVRYEP